MTVKQSELPAGQQPNETATSGIPAVQVGSSVGLTFAQILAGVQAEIFETITNSNGTAVRFSNGIQIAASQGSESWSAAISRFSLGATQSMAGVNYVVREGMPPTYAAPFSSVVALQLQGGRPRASDTEWVRMGSVRPSEVWAEQSPGFESSVFVRWNYIAIGTWGS